MLKLKEKQQNEEMILIQTSWFVLNTNQYKITSLEGKMLKIHWDMWVRVSAYNG